MAEDDPEDIMIYNGGKYPYYATTYKFIQFTLGWSSKKRTLLIEVSDIVFELTTNESGEAILLDFNEDEGFFPSKNGTLAQWKIVYNLGDILETNP